MSKKKVHEVREDLNHRMLLKGFERFDASIDMKNGARYYLETMMEDSGDLETDIKKLQLILRNAKKAGYTRVNLGVSHSEDVYSGKEVAVDPVGWRPESDTEQRARLLAAQKHSEAAKLSAARRKKRAAEKERKDYERLKAKFEGKK